MWTTKGSKLSEAHKRRISEVATGRKLSDAVKLKMSESRKGSTFPDEMKARISSSRTGYVQSSAYKLNWVRACKINRLARSIGASKLERMARTCILF